MSIEVLYAHINIILGNLPKAMSLITRLIKSDINVDFYTRYHLCRLCSLLMFDDCYKKNFRTAYDLSLDKSDLLVSKSCMALLRSLDISHTKNKKYYQEIYEQSLSYREVHPQRELAVLVRLHRQNPYLQQIAFRVLELLGLIWPRSMNRADVIYLIESCEQTISAIMPQEQKAYKNYNYVLLAAKGNIESKRA